MKKTLFVSFIIAFFCIPLFLACENDDKSIPEWPWDTSTDEDPNADIVALGWTRVSDLGTLPDYLQVYKSPDQLEGKKAIAYIAVADMAKATFSVLGEAKGTKTPSEFYSVEKSSIIINGGYFWDGSSLSMLCRDGKIISPNNQIEYRSDATVLYYPTRGVFGLMNDGSYKVNWIYTNNDVTYSYPLPAKNKSGASPLQMPSAGFPEDGTVWEAKTAIGAGPVLIKDGEYVNSYIEELFDSDSGIGPESNNPRTAIGITKSGLMIFFVCEGRNMTPGVVGFTLDEEAKIFQSFGCVEALNLDGGGSSCMLINGKETIKPSDGNQRPVVTAVSLK